MAEKNETIKESELSELDHEYEVWIICVRAQLTSGLGSYGRNGTRCSVGQIPNSIRKTSQCTQGRIQLKSKGCIPH